MPARVYVPSLVPRSSCMGCQQSVSAGLSELPVQGCASASGCTGRQGRVFTGWVVGRMCTGGGLPRGPLSRGSSGAVKKLYRGKQHLATSNPTPQAECKASSADPRTAFLIAVASRSGKYAEHDAARDFGCRIVVQSWRAAWGAGSPDLHAAGQASGVKRRGTRSRTATPLRCISHNTSTSNDGGLSTPQLGAHVPRLT